MKDLKQRVRQAQLKAAVQVNTALLEFYWWLGADIVERQKTAKWGSGFLKQLSADLMAEFPDMKGFSFSNIKYIRQWHLFYMEDVTNWPTACWPIVQQPVAQLQKKLKGEIVEQPVPHSKAPRLADKLVQIPWSHNLRIISKCKDVTEALYYVHKTIENNWSQQF